MSLSGQMSIPVFGGLNGDVGLSESNSKSLTSQTSKALTEGFTSSTNASCEKNGNSRVYVYQWQQQISGQNMDTVEMMTPHFVCIYEARDEKDQPVCPPNDCANNSYTECIKCEKCMASVEDEDDADYDDSNSTWALLL
jgi:hypothetical protein